MILNVLNMDALIEMIMALIIKGAKFPHALKGMKIIPEYNKWQKGERLKILLVGYNGARNTGADVRVEAMVRQFYHILGEENIELSVMTLDIENTSVYFKPPTKLSLMSSIFFADLLKACSRSHIAVLSEGSCFKSKFANALTTFFFGAAGIMKSQGKPCLAYGSEAGEMDWLLRWYVRHYCDQTYVISRTESSRKVVESLGLGGNLGTDTAWTFPPGKKEWAVEELKKKGWDGKSELLGIAVINPFWWPVRPNIIKFLKMVILREKRPDNYDKWYFFSVSKQREEKFNRYIGGIAQAVDSFVDRHNLFPVIIGMERLDYQPCLELQKRLKVKAPFFWSEDYDGYQMTSILRQLSLLITSRYHARVLSMPGGVPSLAISMDERLQNLLEETGHINDYYLEAGDPNLGERLPETIEKLWKNRETVREEILRTIPNYLKKMATMGKTIKDYLRVNFPELTLKEDPDSWPGYLPPLYSELEDLIHTSSSIALKV